MAQIVGFEVIKGTSKAGRELDAVKIYVVAPQKGVTGFAADSLWLDRPEFEAASGGRSFEKLLNKECQVNRDLRGRVDSVTIAD